MGNRETLTYEEMLGIGHILNKIGMKPPELPVIDKQMQIAGKIDWAMQLDRNIKNYKKELDKVKAELQALALEDMENKNIKYVQGFGNLGSFEAMYKEKLEIDNFALLIAVLGNVATDKVTRKVEVKFDIETRFKQSLIALLKGEFKEHNLDEILENMGLEGRALTVAKKKLKGEYRADKKLLESLGVKGEREEELDAIREVKNLELAQRYFDLASIDMEKLQKALYLEETLSITLNHKEDATNDGVCGENGQRTTAD